DAARLPLPKTLAGLVIIAPTAGSDDAFLRLAFRLLQYAGPALRQGHGLFATIARLDGSFGLDAGASDPTSGGLAGLAKTAAREWPEICARALGLAPEFSDPEEAALAIANELTTDGPVEVGLSPRGVCTLGLEA